MKVTTEALWKEMRQIGRALLGPLPGYADGVQNQQDALNQEEQRRGHGLINTWIQYQQGRHQTFTIYKNGGGITRKELPLDVDPSSVVKIEIKSANKPVTKKLEQLRELVERLKTGESVSVCGTHENIEFVSSDGA